MSWSILPYSSLLLLFLLPLFNCKLTCTKCPFTPTPPHANECNETCEGDVCYIIVNQYFNGTIIAGCVNLHEGDSFRNQSVCHREERRTTCACVSDAQCNDPQSPLAKFEFIDETVLNKYQTLPQIQPSMPDPTIGPERTSTEEKLIEVKSSMIIKNDPLPTQPLEFKPSSIPPSFLPNPSAGNGKDITKLAEIKATVTPFPASQPSQSMNQVPVLSASSSPSTLSPSHGPIESSSEADKPLNLKPPNATLPPLHEIPSSPVIIQRTTESTKIDHQSINTTKTPPISIDNSSIDEVIIPENSMGSVEETDLQSTVKFGSDNRVPKDPLGEASAQTGETQSASLTSTLTTVLIPITLWCF